jgi:hypothetical protein
MLLPKSQIYPRMYGTIINTGQQSVTRAKRDLLPAEARQYARRGQRANEMMMPGNDGTVATGRETGKRGRWYRPIRCSICTSFIWFRPIVLKEPVGAPEPRYEWVLCKPCHEALLVEIRRSSLRSPVHLRIAIGLVAAERSPKAYQMGTPVLEQWEFQREFTWAVRLLILFALLHLVIFVILLAVPK